MHSTTYAPEVSSSSSVLRNTYLLLSVTLLWSALTATLGTHVQMGLWAYLGLVVAGFATLFATFAFRNSGWGLVFVFAFTGIQGFSLGPVLNHYLDMKNGAQLISMTAGLTAAVFISLSAYVLITRKNFEFLGGMLFVGLIGLIIASLVSLFFPVPGVQLALAGVGALIFSGYILYDTSAIIHGGETNYVVATVSLYLDILNLFLDLLRLVTAFGGDD
jgi:modulator of FtsH protease